MSIRSLGADDLARWERLGGEASEPNPFFEPAFVMPAARVLGEENLMLLVGKAADSWRLCIPVIHRRRWGRIPLPGWVAWGSIYSYIGTPLMAGGCEREAADDLLDWLRPPRCTTYLGIDLFGRGGSALAAIHAAAAARDRRPITYLSLQRAVLPRRDDGNYLAINRKHQREINRMGRRLAEELGGPIETRDRAGDPAAVEDFLKLEAAGWKGRAGTAFSSMGHAEVLREICAGFAERGRLQMLSLGVEGRPVAMQCNIRAGSTIFLFKIAFDESLARFSPGIQLQVKNVDLFDRDRDFDLMDSCAVEGNNMINRLWKERLELEAVAIPAAGARGRLAGAGVSVAARLRGGDES